MGDWSAVIGDWSAEMGDWSAERTHMQPSMQPAQTYTHTYFLERDETPRASGGGSSCSQILLYTLSGGALSHVRVNSEHTCSRFGAVARTSRRGRLPRVVRVLSRSRVGARSTLPPSRRRARPLGGDPAGPDRSVRAQRLAAPRTVRATRGASEHPRVPIFFSAFALRSIIQHKYVAPPAQNPYGLYSMMPCMAAPLPPEPRGPVPLLVPRSLLVQPWAVLGHSVRCTRASMASVPLTPL